MYEVIIAAGSFFVILYFVVKAAVRNGISEARIREKAIDIAEDDAISQTKCRYCGRSYDIDYPRCPHCKQ